MKRTRFIPKDATAIEHAQGVVYTYSDQGRLCAIAYSGKCTRSDWHLFFRDEARRSQRIEQYLASLNAHAQQVAKKRQQRTEPHTLKVGDIVYNSWGYEQTNVDFYEVVRVSAYYVWLQPLARNLQETGHMSGRVTPQPGTRHGEVSKHRVNVYNGNESVHFEYGAALKWDGSPISCSWYA